MNPQTLELWKNSFMMYTKENGKVSLSDLELLVRLLGYNPTAIEIEDMKNEIKGEDEIDFYSFAYILYRHSRYSRPEEELERSFAIFDTENTGNLSYSIAQHILQSMKHPFTENQADKIIDRAGLNDGQVEIKSLVKVLLNL